MANANHLRTLKRGVAAWNKWRKEKPKINPDLSEADLQEMDLTGVNLQEVNLYEANLHRANLTKANLKGADLTGVNMSGAILRYADLREAELALARLGGAELIHADLFKANLGSADLDEAELGKACLQSARLFRALIRDANLSEADLSEADLTEATLFGSDLFGVNLADAKLHGTNLMFADLRYADLSGANLQNAQLVHTDLSNAVLHGCSVFGAAVWEVNLDKAHQKELIITTDDQATITVDSLEVAQFIYLLLNREKLRNIISTIGQKAVLILGRFIPERKAVLDDIADELKQRGLLPIIFDFERSQERDFTETIKVLAGLSLFVIADMTNPKSNPLELQATIPDYMIPFVPLIQEGEQPFAMFVNLQNTYHWVLPVVEYDTKENLIAGLDEAVIKPALSKRRELIGLKAEQLKTVNIKDIIGKRKK